MLLRPGISATNASPLSVQRTNTSADNTSAPNPSPSVPGPGNAFSGALNDGSFQRCVSRMDVHGPVNLTSHVSAFVTGFLVGSKDSAEAPERSCG